jgi:uncharacterized membrane protein YphA (DoxX/SURF4 family)
MQLDPLLTLIAAICLSALFATAALHKWREPLHFEGVLGQYKLLPRKWVGVTAKTIPYFELIIALLLLINLSRTLAAIMALLTLSVYSLAIAINLSRGRREIDCGCGGQATQLSSTLIWRNLCLLSIATAALVPNSPRVLSSLDLVVALIGAAAFGLCYISWNQLLANHSYKQKVWK